MGHRYFAVRGHQRSGTNWTGAVLNLHPRICCVGEFQFERIWRGFDFIKHPAYEGGKREQRDLIDHTFETFARRSLDMAAISKLGDLPGSGKAKGIELVGDRSPNRLYPMLPDLPQISVMRDGRDVVVSLVLHLLRLGRGFNNFLDEMAPTKAAFKADPHHFESHPHDLLKVEGLIKGMATAWAKHMVDDHAMADRMNSGEVTGRAMIVRYEDLHADVEGVRAKMYEFLELDPAEAAAISTGDKTRAGFGDTGEDPLSHYRAGKAGAWRNYFHRDAARWFHEATGDVLQTLGYETDANWWTRQPEAGEIAVAN